MIDTHVKHAAVNHEYIIWNFREHCRSVAGVRAVAPRADHKPGTRSGVDQQVLTQRRGTSSSR